MNSTVNVENEYNADETYEEKRGSKCGKMAKEHTMT